MFPLSALLAHAELKTKAKRPSVYPAMADATSTDAGSTEARRAERVTRYGNLTLFPLVERAVAVDEAGAYRSGEAMSDEVIDAVWEEPRVIASISNISTSGVGLILDEELPAGLQFDVNWAEGAEPGPVRFEVVHTKPLSAGLYRTGARLIAGALPAEPVPTPFVRRFAMASDADPAQPTAPATALVPAATMAPAGMPERAEQAEPPRREYAPLSLVRDGVMALSKVVADPAPAYPTPDDVRHAPAGTFPMSAALGFEKTERLDGVTTCGWERSIEMRREGDRMWIYIHSPGKKNGWGLYVDPNAFESAVARLQAGAGSPFIATTLAA